MDTFDYLSIVSCVTSTVTLFIIAIATLPHVKAGAVIIRDIILWISLVAILVGFVWFAVNRGTASSNSRPLPTWTFSTSDSNDGFYAGRN